MSAKISIVIPAYNESKTIKTLLGKVLKINFPYNAQKEIIIVNDCSKDNTGEIINDISKKNKIVKAIHNEMNLGKSQSVKKGILNTTGDYVVIQDADLEYDPKDLIEMFRNIHDDNLDVVYGNRFGKNNKVIYWKNYIGNRGLSAFSNIFTFPRIKKFIPDMEVCYKLIKGKYVRDIAQTLVSKSNFGFEPEITAKLSKYKTENKKHLKFAVFPISYSPRTIEEGKSMRAFHDGFKAFREILRFNLTKGN